MQHAEKDVLGLDTGLEALQASPDFPGLVETVAEHQSYDHLERHGGGI